MGSLPSYIDWPHGRRVFDDPASWWPISVLRASTPHLVAKRSTDSASLRRTNWLSIFREISCKRGVPLRQRMASPSLHTSSGTTMWANGTVRPRYPSSSTYPASSNSLGFLDISRYTLELLDNIIK